MTAPRNRIVRLLTASVVGLVATMAAPLVGSAGADDAEPVTGVRLAGKLPRVPAEIRALFGDAVVPNAFDMEVGESERSQDTKGNSSTAGTIILLPEIRQLWQLYPHDRFSANEGTWIAIRDLDSLKLVDTFEIKGTLNRGFGGGDWRYALDPGKRIFLTSAEVVIEVDLRTHEQKRYPFTLLPAGVSSTGLTLGGITYDPADGPQGSLLSLYGGPGSFGVLNVNTYLVKRDLATGAVTTPRQIRACNGSLPSTEGQWASYGAEVLTTPTHLYVACQRSGSSAEVVRLARTTAFVNGSPEDAVVGPVGLEAAFADPAAGRFHLVTQAGEDWVFDISSMSFVGVAAGKTDERSLTAASYGFDRETGRSFFKTATNGFGVVEGRFFPVPQARTVARPDYWSHERIYYDAKTSRAFVLEGIHAQKHHDYLVFEVEPALPPPPPPDPDVNTADIAEKPNVTEARYFASASGYGARAVIAKGLVAVAPSPSLASISAAPMITSQYLNSRCGYTDRELTAGRVFKTEYDTGSTAAEAIAVGVDERTKLDLDQPSRCDIYGSNNGNEVFHGIFGTAPQETKVGDRSISPAQAVSGDDRWGRKPASCSSSEGEEAQTATGIDTQPEVGDTGRTVPVPPLGVSEVTCPEPGNTMEAYAEAKLDGQLKVANGWTRTKVWKAADGVHSRAEAVAKGIDIANGAVTIGEIHSVAESVSNGRPRKGDMSTHQMKILRVAIGGDVLCEVCAPQEVVDVLNTLLVGRAQFRVAEGMDARLRKGTPKGALTAVQKSEERQVSDQSLIGDFTNEVPAFEIIVYNDHYYWGRARQLYQFAGVGTVATYNISVQPTGFGLDDEGDGGGLPGDELTPDGEEALDGLGSGAPDVGGAPISSGRGGGFFGAVADAAKALLRGIRVFFTNPRQSLLLLTAWALLLLPGYLARRRRLLTASTTT